MYLRALATIPASDGGPKQVHRGRGHSRQTLRCGRGQVRGGGGGGRLPRECRASSGAPCTRWRAPGGRWLTIAEGGDVVDTDTVAIPIEKLYGAMTEKRCGRNQSIALARRNQSIIVRCTEERMEKRCGRNQLIVVRCTEEYFGLKIVPKGALLAFHGIPVAYISAHQTTTSASADVEQSNTSPVSAISNLALSSPVSRRALPGKALGSLAMVAITLPSSMEQIPLVMKCPRANAAAVPHVDLSAPGAAAAVADACRRVGFFRATNHGVPAGMADALEARAMAFFALPHREKQDMSCSSTPLGYGSKSIGSNGDVGWLEYLLLSVGSGSVPGSSLPPSLQVALEEYTRAVREVGGRVLELMAEGLGLREDDRTVLRRMVAGAGSDELVRVNHYPPCPLAAGQPGRDCGVTGFGEHTDPQIISVLRSNRTAGLQIKLRDGRWVPVAPDPDSLFVNVGDSLQVLTNGRFRSVKHRVVAPDGKQASRLSVIYFGGPAASQRIAPLPQVMREGEQSLYREFTWAEYKTAAYKTRLADHRLGPFELPLADQHCIPTATATATATTTCAQPPLPPQQHVARVY